MHLMYFTEQPMSAYPAQAGKDFGATALMFSNKHFDPVAGSRLYNEYIEHYKLADIVGGPTAGTNGNVNPLTLPGGYQVMWTGMKVLKHDGSRHHGVGIQPTVPVTRTIRGIAEGRDEVVDRAVAVVSP